jgi:3-carboxy-cis,cis-muconate cycloisomerase
MARDISLMAQHEVAELAEPGAPGRGGSSTMPHKQNPVGSAATLAAAQRVPGLVASFLSAMVQEHERALGGWQAEWPIVSDIIQSTGLALAAMAETAEGLTVDEERMQANMEATHGLIFAERATMLLAQTSGRAAAQELIQKAATRALTERRNFTQVLMETPEISDHISPQELADLENARHYLGSAEEFRKALLGISVGARVQRVSSLKKKR